MSTADSIEAAARVSRATPPSLSFTRQVRWTATFTQAVAAAYEALVTHRLRSAFTLLALAVGVVGVLSIAAYGRYADVQVANTLAQFGSNLIAVSPDAPRTSGARTGKVNTLTAQDAAAIRQEVPHVAAVSAFTAVTSQRVVAGHLDWTTTVQGVSADYPNVQHAPAIAGSFFAPEDDASVRPVAVLGYEVARRLFPEGGAVGQQIRINLVNFEVVSVLGERGRTALANLDDVVYVPLTTVQRRLVGGTSVDGIQLRVDQRTNIPGAMRAATEILQRTHHIRPGQPDDFRVQNYQLVADRARQSSETLGAVLDAIAALALLIGGFGVLNLMLVGVAERTQEIGIRLAVGARQADVLRQFMLESAVLAALGAGFGGLLGLGGTCYASWRLGLQLLPSPGLVVLAVGVSVVTGLIFGVYPARRAASLDPIEALRQE